MKFLTQILRRNLEFNRSFHFFGNPSLRAKCLSKCDSIPRNQERVKDYTFDKYMEIEKKKRKILKFRPLILNESNGTVAISRLNSLARRNGFKDCEVGSLILKFPHIFQVYEHPVMRILYCRLTQKALLQIKEEEEALLRQLPDAIIRLRKLLMMSNSGRVHLEHVRIARSDFGLPDDFELSVVLKNPNYFRLIEDHDSREKFIKLVEQDPDLAVCAIDKYRETEYRTSGMDAEDIRFAFSIKFPPGYRTPKRLKIALWKWQRTPYWSPYDDITHYDLRSSEAQARLEKTAVATVHELLSLTVEKKITLERIAQFKSAMNLPKNLKEFLLRHQGIFYISTRGNHGQLHTVFLRGAYHRGDLIQPTELYLARRKLCDLLLLSPRKAPIDQGIVNN